MNNVEYWKNRARQKMLASERSTLKILRNTRKLYKQAQKTVIQEIEKMYEQAGATYGDDVAKYMKETLHGDERSRLIRDLKKYIKSKGLDYTLSDDFERRLTRLDALQKKIEIELINLRKQTQTLQTKGYKEVMSTVYGYDAKDVEEIGKYPIGGGNLEKRVISEVSRNDSNWADGTYRTRNTKNVNNMTSKINSIVGAGMSIGQSREKTARQVREEFGISSRKAMRLVQTESNYYAGQVDLEAYRAMGVEYYQYLDILDEKTCEGCQELDTKVFPVDMANVGVNYHPMHPNCRCGTVPYDPEMDADGTVVRSARDVVTNQSYLTTAKDYEGYKISQNMKHGKGAVQLAAKKNANITQDREQYARYKKVLGDRWKTLDDFQNMKYEDVKEYGKMKVLYREEKKITTEGIEKGLKSLEKNLDKLSLDEKESLYAYTRAENESINKYLSGEYQETRLITERIKDIDNAINKSVLTNNIKVYRGDEAQYHKNLKEGDIFQQGVYWSSSIYKKVANRFADEKEKNGKSSVFLEIYIPKGTKCLSLSNISYNPAEHEILLARNLRYKVLDLEQDKIILTVVND